MPAYPRSQRAARQTEERPEAVPALFPHKEAGQCLLSLPSVHSHGTKPKKAKASLPLGNPSINSRRFFLRRRFRRYFPCRNSLIGKKQAAQVLHFIWKSCPSIQRVIIMHLSNTNYFSFSMQWYSLPMAWINPGDTPEAQRFFHRKRALQPGRRLGNQSGRYCPTGPYRR